MTVSLRLFYFGRSRAARHDVDDNISGGNDKMCELEGFSAEWTVPVDTR